LGAVAPKHGKPTTTVWKGRPKLSIYGHRKWNVLTIYGSMSPYLAICSDV
jgi:hypothetical protein